MEYICYTKTISRRRLNSTEVFEISKSGIPIIEVWKMTQHCETCSVKNRF